MNLKFGEILSASSKEPVKDQTVNDKVLTIDQAYLTKILDLYKKEPSTENNTKLMITTLKIFTKNFTQAIESKNFESVTSFICHSEELFQCISEQSEIERRNCREDLETFECLKIITFNLISILKAGQIGSSPLQLQTLQKLLDFSLKMAFMLKEVTLHILLADAFKTTLLERDVIVEDLPLELQEWVLDTMPTICIRSHRDYIVDDLKG